MDPNVTLKAGHPPARMAGGRRKSQPTFVPVFKSKQEEDAGSKDARNDEGSQELIRQNEWDEKMFLNRQVREQQRYDAGNHPKYTNSSINRGPAMAEAGRIRQPGRFQSGLPKETIQAMKEM